MLSKFLKTYIVVDNVSIIQIKCDFHKDHPGVSTRRLNEILESHGHIIQDGVNQTKIDEFLKDYITCTICT